MNPEASLSQSQGRNTLRFERVFRVDIDQLWHAVSSPSQLDLWFPASVPWTPRAGEKLEVMGMICEVTDASAPTQLAWNFAGDDYLFTLTPLTQGTQLVFCHTFANAASAAQNAAGWDSYLQRLAALLAGSPLSEAESHRDWESVHERYAELFGVDPTPGREFAAAWRAQQQQLHIESHVDD